MQQKLQAILAMTVVVSSRLRLSDKTINSNLKSCKQKNTLPGGRVFLSIYLLHRPSAGYIPLSVISFREATTKGLSAA